MIVDLELKNKIKEYYESLHKSGGFTTNEFAVDIVRLYIYEKTKKDIVEMSNGQIFISGINDIEYLQTMFNTALNYFETKYTSTKVIEIKTNKVCHIRFDS